MATRNDFIEAGYKYFIINDLDIYHEYARCLLQKGIRNEEGKLKYYINIYEYRKPISGLPTFTGEVQFYKADDTLDVELGYVSSPEHAEEWFERIWENLAMDYDPHND